MAGGASYRLLFSFFSLFIACSNADKIKAISNEDTSSTTLFPTSPSLTTPTIVTIPSTKPITATPDASTTIPPATPVTLPPVNPFDSPMPITNPATTPSVPFPGAQPVGNPATTYPNTPVNPATTPVTNPVNPVTTPVTNPVTPPVTTNAPAIPGQSWCVAKSGVSEASLQAGLDYACGMGGADCSQIQQSGSCYTPSTIQNHASYAFNSYYQKNPGAASCDFGGAAMITNTNPSSGSCVYPSSSSSASTSSMSPSTTNPATTPPSTTSSPLPGMGFSGNDTPPSLNSSDPASAGTTGFGIGSPPTITSSDSESAGLRPLIDTIILVTFLVSGRLMLHM